MKKNTVQAQQWLEKCYGDFAPSKTTIYRWYAEFKRGRTDTEDAERSGQSNEVVTPETIKKVHQIYEEAVVKVGAAFAHGGSKTKRVVDSERCLELFCRNKSN